ncbi:hypothetical protein QR685DRAFT_557197 [Neurospora intermedia]|uniref:Uncharacterized protein n=1 Tax=Neurospora intermedia TaxID=5142 RepID=A0ABR3D0N3_NEUIN
MNQRTCLWRQSLNQARKRTRPEAGLDENLNLPLPLPHQNVKHFEPSKPVPVAITQLETCVRTTTKVVNLHIPQEALYHGHIHTPLIIAVIYSLFALDNAQRLKYWRLFEREGTPNQWFC